MSQLQGQSAGRCARRQTGAGTAFPQRRSACYAG